MSYNAKVLAALLGLAATASVPQAGAITFFRQSAAAGSPEPMYQFDLDLSKCFHTYDNAVRLFGCGNATWVLRVPTRNNSGSYLWNPWVVAHGGQKETLCFRAKTYSWYGLFSAATPTDCIPTNNTSNQWFLGQVTMPQYGTGKFEADFATTGAGVGDNSEWFAAAWDYN